MVKVKMANPGPAALMVINPKKGSKTMATTRRTTRRKTSARRTTTTYASTKRRNPTRRVTASSRRRSTRRRSARRNPAATGLIKSATGIAAGMAGVGLIGMFVPPIGGNSVFAVAGRQAGVGWLLGEAMQRFGILRAYASDVKLAGLALGVGTLINAYVMPTVSGFLRPKPQQPAEGSSQMAGIAPIYRGLQPFRSYGNGLNGIAMIDPTMQPYGEYAN